MPPAQSRLYAAICGLFFLPGFAWATWVTRTPALRDALSASTEQMGMILFGFSCGSMSGILLSGKLTLRFGARRVIGVGLVILLAGLLVLAASIPLVNPWVAFAGLSLFGIGMGLTDVAINIEAADFEQKLGRPVMTALHGFFSLGTLVGAVLGMSMTALEVSVGGHFTVVAVLALLAMSWLITRLPPTPAVDPEAPSEAGGQGALWVVLRDKSLWVIGVVILAMALAEGSANDWLPLLMIDGHDFAATTGTLVYVGFTLGMTVGRFAGNRFVVRYGRAAVLRFSALSAALGLLLVIFSHLPWLAAVAVLCWGVGASLGFPLAITAAGESGNHSAMRVTLAATLGYVAFLVGPPSLGFIGEHWGLRLAMIPVLAMVVLAFFAAGSAKEKARDPAKASV